MEQASHTHPATGNSSLKSAPSFGAGNLLRVSVVASALMVLTIVNPTSLFSAEPDGPDIIITPEDALEYQLIGKIKTTIRGNTDYDRKIQKGLKAFYLQHDRKPVWLNKTGLTPIAQKAISEIKKGHEFGLNVHDIALPSQDLINGQPEQRADAELMISQAIVAYAKRAKGGNLIPQKISRFLDNTPQYLDPLDVLTSVVNTNDMSKTFISYHPEHPQYWALKKKLDEVRAATGALKPKVIIPAGPIIRPFDRHEDIVLLRQRLNQPVPLTNGRPLYPQDIYDSTLVEVVKNYQSANNIKATGIINKTTRLRLNKRNINPEKKLLANMERWRWVPTSFGNNHIRVNIPEYLVRVTKNDKIIHTERVIIGKTKHKTPSFSDEMETIVFNPYWNVPQSIIWNEMGGVAPRGYESRTVNGRVFIRQPPGPRNALGRVKFLFPNKHAVYLHDTPTKSLFNRSSRAFSHGCMRLRDPLKMAEILLAPEGLTKKNVRSRVNSGRNQRIDLKNKIPVHVTYFTVWASEDGSIKHFNDVYGHDKRVVAALQGRPIGLEPRQKVKKRPLEVVKKKKKPSSFISLFFSN